MTRPILAALFVVSSLVAGFVACGGTSTSDGPSVFPPDANGPPAVLPAADAAGQTFGNADGSTALPPPAVGTPDRACYDYEGSDRNHQCHVCCANNHQDGQKVFAAAIDQCACQPSKCGDDALCGQTQCASPRAATNTAACAACYNNKAFHDADGGVNPALDAGFGAGSSSFPELGIQACEKWASDTCQTSTACQAWNTCILSAQCNRANPAPDAGASDAAPTD